MSWMLMLLAKTALAADFKEGFQDPSDSGVRVALRGVGESLADQGLSAVYRTSMFNAGLAFIIPFHERLQADIEASYSRVLGYELIEETGNTSEEAERMEMIPTSFLVEYAHPLSGGGQLFAGLGPALVAFQVLHSANEDNADTTVTTGVKIATELRMGARFNTGMIQAPLAPVSADAAEALELEIYMGRRHQFNPSGVGFNLSAWRIGGGLALRF